MAFTALVMTTLEILEADQFGSQGRTTTYRVQTIKVVGADRHHQQTHPLEADAVDEQILIDPTGSISNVASTSIIVLEATTPVDVRFNSLTSTRLSGIRNLVMAMTVSSIFVTNGSQANTIRTEVVGGSGAAVITSRPTP